MSYTLVTETTFSSDAYTCPICDHEATGQISAAPPYIKFLMCLGGHPYYYLETVTGPTSGAGELGYWLPA